MNSSATSSCPSVVYSNSVAYLLVLAGIGVAMHIWKLPPALPDLQKQLGLSLVESGFLLSIVQIAGMSLGLVMGLLAQQMGLRRCILAGLVITALSSAGGALVEHKEALMLLRGLEGTGFLMVVLACPTVIRLVVAPANFNRLLGLWGSYIPLASVLVLLGGSWILSMFDWRVLWLLLGGLVLVLAALVWRIVPNDRVLQTYISSSGKQPKKASSWSLLKATFKSEGVWLVAGIMGFYTCQWIAIIGFLPSIYMLGGISGIVAGVLTAIVAGSNAIGTFGAGFLLHRGLKSHVLIISGFLIMISSAFLAFALDLPVIWRFFAVLIFSIFGGLVPTTLFVVLMRVAPSAQTISTSLGWMQQVSALGQFLGPPLVAWVATVAGGWQATWVATGSCALVGIGLALRLRAKHP